MKLKISDSSSIQILQKEFSATFPFLKIEFFSKPHKRGQASGKKDMIDSKKSLGESREKHNKGDLTVTKDMTVNELESLFEKNYGLHAQVFRKSGKLWLETTATDSWTLNSQNEQGRELQGENLGRTRDENDYHEQE